jgi:transcriptional regulator with XRE-family HTH domain
MKNKIFCSNPPNQVARIRKLRGFNRKVVARLFGQETTVTIGYWETGFKYPNLKNAIKLQILLGARIDQLFPKLAAEAAEELESRKH